MVNIKVDRDGDCRVTVRGDWPTVYEHMKIAAANVRKMALDSREFADLATAELPMRIPKRRFEPMPDARTARTTRPPEPIVRETATRQPVVTRPGRSERSACAGCDFENGKVELCNSCARSGRGNDVDFYRRTPERSAG